MSRFVAIDFETANRARDSACSIGLVRVEDGKIVDRAVHYIRPPYRDFWFTHIHGLRWEDVAASPDFGGLWPALCPWFDGIDFAAAHNARFDTGVLQACCSTFNLATPPVPFVCTVQIARAVWNVRPTDLKSVARFLCVKLDHHEALSDATACAEIVIAAELDGWRPPAPQPEIVPEIVRRNRSRSAHMSRTEQRSSAVADVMTRVRAIERDAGVTRESLARMKQELLALADRRELFPAEDFLPPPEGDERNSCLYRLSEDADHRFALYINAARPGTHSPAHNHTTWAVIVGLQGEELNRMYDRVPATGVAEKAQAVVKRGTGVTFLPDDLHSIHIDGEGVTLNFHMYGLALEQLHRREYWRPKDGDWRIFPAHSDIRDARV